MTPERNVAVDAFLLYLDTNIFTGSRNLYRLAVLLDASNMPNDKVILVRNTQRCANSQLTPFNLTANEDGIIPVKDVPSVNFEKGNTGAVSDFFDSL